MIRDSDEAERLQIALIENMVREDLNPVEEARACAALVEDLGLSKEELARRVGRSRPAVSNLIRLLDLPDETLELLEGGELSEGHGRAVLAVRGNDARRRLARSAASDGWSVRETERGPSWPASQGGSRGAEPVHPEEEAAMRDAADRLEEAVGHEVRCARAGRRSQSRSASTTSPRPTRWPGGSASQGLTGAGRAAGRRRAAIIGRPEGD